MISVVPYGTRNIIGHLVQPPCGWLISGCPCGTLRRRKICRLLSPSVASRHGALPMRIVVSPKRYTYRLVPLIFAYFRLFPGSPPGTASRRNFFLRPGGAWINWGGWENQESQDGPQPLRKKAGRSSCRKDSGSTLAPPRCDRSVSFGLRWAKFGRRRSTTLPINNQLITINIFLSHLRRLPLMYFD
jgi:hypothetical protein